MCYYTQYKCTFVHNVRINNVPKQCVQLLYTYNLNIEENKVGPDSRQVPNRSGLGGVLRLESISKPRLSTGSEFVSQWVPTRSLFSSKCLLLRAS